jgi:predicted flap endonuclease-1-like 5' DNA nuclease
MYLISQTMIYLLLALLVGGGIGYAFRACLADTACDDLRDDLALAQNRLADVEAHHAQAAQAPPQSPLPTFAQSESSRALTRPALTPFVPQPRVSLGDTFNGLPVAPEMGGPAQKLDQMTARDFETALLGAAPGLSPKSRFEAEDLTAIIGLTPAMDAFLGKIGITRLADIESLTPAELYWLVDNLPGDGASIYKDQWVAQASKLLGKA